MSIFNRLGVAALILGIATGLACANETTISGAARVVDERTLSVDRTYVQLEGVDVAEAGTPWGDLARRWLTELVADSKDGVTCKLTGNVSATSRRALGRCYVTGDNGDNSDVGEKLILFGVALACPAEVGDRYDFAEKNEGMKKWSPGKQPRSGRCAVGK